MQKRIVLNGELPSMNEIIEAAKIHAKAYSRMKKKYTELVAWQVKGIPKQDSVFLDITWYAKNKRKDPDNIAAGIKFIMDGLVMGGVIENDGWQQNKGWTNSFEIDKDNPRVEINIRGSKND